MGYRNPNNVNRPQNLCLFALLSFAFSLFSTFLKPLRQKGCHQLSLNLRSAKTSGRAIPLPTLSNTLNKSSDSSLIGLNQVTFPKLNQSFHPGNWICSLNWVTCPVWRQGGLIITKAMQIEQLKRDAPPEGGEATIFRKQKEKCLLGGKKKAKKNKHKF